MLSRKITDGTEFVVFDMEWNQPMPGKEYPFEVSKLTGEIIEIGALKYTYDNGELVYRDSFSTDIIPVKYTKLHYHVKKVTHKKNSDLQKGIPFKEAYTLFREFCGDAILVGWGSSDPAMLKMNLEFFGMDSKLGMFFLDLQPIFSLFAGLQGMQRSVEAAVDFYNIDKKEIFHSATADAHYTGAVFEEIFNHNKPSEVISAISSSSIDPDVPSDFSFVGPECLDSNTAFTTSGNFMTSCPLCGGKLGVKIPPFRIRKSQYALLECREHGELFSRTRVKKNKAGNYYAAAVMRFATQNDYWLVASKKEEFDKYGEKGKPVEKTEEEDNAT